MGGGISFVFGGKRYDRTQALIDGRVKPEGIDLSYDVIEEADSIFRRMLNKLDFDASEFSLSSYIRLKSREKDHGASIVPFIALPIFPSRLFRHSYIFCNRNSGIKEPADLVGKKVGIMQWEQTALVWIRGILQHEYGVALDTIHWVQFRREVSGFGKPRQFYDIVDSAQLDTETSAERASDALERGEIDALLQAQVPRSLYSGRNVRRLFDRWYDLELEYYSKRKIFPIMHTIVLKKSIYSENRWLSKSLVEAFDQAKRLAYEQLTDVGDTISCAGLRKVFEDQVRVIGNDPYPYNIEDNRNTIETLMQYQLEQKVTESAMPLTDLFANV